MLKWIAYEVTACHEFRPYFTTEYCMAFLEYGSVSHHLMDGIVPNT